MAVSLQGVEMLTRARSLGADLGPLGGDNRADPGVRVLAAGSAPLHSLSNKLVKSEPCMQLHAAIFLDLRVTPSVIRQFKSCHLR